MGLFTNIRNPNNPSELIQFRFGNDELKIYSVGDKVPQEIDKHHPGEVYFSDGIELSSCGDWYALIKDAIIVGLESRIVDDEGDDNYDQIWEKYEIQSFVPPRKWWPEHLWKEKEERERQWELKFQEFERSIAHLSPEEQFLRRFARPLSQAYNYSGLISKIMKVEPLEPKE